jgi:hypothetical protein
VPGSYGVKLAVLRRPQAPQVPHLQYFRPTWTTP